MAQHEEREKAERRSKRRKEKEQTTRKWKEQRGIKEGRVEVWGKAKRRERGRGWRESWKVRWVGGFVRSICIWKKRIIAFRSAPDSGHPPSTRGQMTFLLFVVFSSFSFSGSGTLYVLDRDPPLTCPLSTPFLSFPTLSLPSPFPLLSLPHFPPTNISRVFLVSELFKTLPLSIFSFDALPPSVFFFFWSCIMHILSYPLFPLPSFLYLRALGELLAIFQYIMYVFRFLFRREFSV